mmetsp:Transcript_17653/g.24647  ORF Transcript_17653/g.24647 Transcript_17653/m.24647 type:complete len:92 (+) Transcript_17653:260-535(+)
MGGGTALEIIATYVNLMEKFRGYVSRELRVHTATTPTIQIVLRRDVQKTVFSSCTTTLNLSCVRCGNWKLSNATVIILWTYCSPTAHSSAE